MQSNPTFPSFQNLDPAAQSAARVMIDLEALAANFNFLKKCTETELMPVIKADAYGHGLLPCANRLVSAGAAWLAVGTVREGALLREGGVDLPLIALLGCLDPDDAELALRQAIVPFAGSIAHLKTIAAKAGKNPAKVALKFNTGMNRLGFTPEDLPALLEWLAANPAVRPVVAASHLASADENGGVRQTDRQIREFSGICQALRVQYPAINTSLYNSAGLLAHSHKFATDLARPGLTLYGANPLYGTALNRPEIDAGLRAAMQVWAPVAQVHPLKRGESISYGATFTAPCDMRVAVVAAGYAQGYSRGLSGQSGPSRLPGKSGGSEMNLHGRRCPVLGRICMARSIFSSSLQTFAKLS